MSYPALAPRLIRATAKGLINDGGAFFKHVLFARHIQRVKRSALKSFLPCLMLGLLGAAARVTRGFQNVIFLRVLLNKELQSFVELRQLPRFCAGINLIAVAVVGHDLAIFDFE